MSLRKANSPRASATFIDIEHNGQIHRVVVKRVATARRYTLRVRSARRDVVLTVPPHGSKSAARTFALRYAGWISEKLAALAPATPFEAGRVIPFRGEPHRLVRAPGLRRSVTVHNDPDGSSLRVSGPGDFAQTLRVFLREAARLDLRLAAERHASTLGRTVTGVTLRDTRSRWGSCSSRGTLSFSWRLIMAPPFVLDYLAAHEVAHLVHMNHSADFWSVVARLYGDIEAPERWLKQHGASLHHFGP